ncbi:MAG: peptidyl-prolyl cis-trans isomerase [Candidatus Omnitrophota bacterium]|nr:peptidyl-prolyl cis-trans isomerase [Candidatus Omnitrophota bacterium]
MQSYKTKRFKSLFLCSVFLFFVFLAGCDKLPFLSNLFPAKTNKQSTPTLETPTIQGTLLAKVDNWVLTLEDYNQKIQDLRQVYPDFKVESFDDKKTLLEELIRQQLLVQDAKLRQLDRKKEVSLAVEEFRRGLLVREIINVLTEDIKIEPKEIENYYNQFKDSFRESQQWRVREIVVSTQDQAKQILIEALKGGDFASLATQYSKSPSASKGGDLGFIAQAKFPQLDAVLSTLEVGGISNVVKGPDGFYIVKLEERKGGKEKPLSDVWDEIKEGLTVMKQSQKLQDYITKLKQNAKIEIHEDLLR